LQRQFMAHRRIIYAVLENERVAASAEPVQRRGHGNRAGVAMIAKPGIDFLDARADEGAVRKAATRRVHLIDVERVPVDERTERFATALSLARRNWNRRTVAQPHVAVDVPRPEWFFEPAWIEFGKLLSAAQCCARIPDTAGVDEQRVLRPNSFACAANQ